MSSKTLKFKDKYFGQLVDVEPGWGWPGECVSLVQRFIIEEIGAKAKARGDGKAWRTVLINEGLGKRVDRNDIRIGDIIAWDGKKGHVAICLGGDVIFEQIGPKGKAKIGSIAYWDRVQPSKGLVTRLNNFVDAEEKTTRELALEVIEGKYGNGEARKKALGERYEEVQKEVNAILKGSKNEPKPSPKPSNVGKTAQLRGTVTLYPNSTGGTKYIPSGKSRNLKILDEANGRFKVSSKDFNPNTVWVNAKDVKVV